MTRLLCTTGDIVRQVRGTSGPTVNGQLEGLITMFAQAARSIDPTIGDVWVVRTGQDLKQPSFISFDRGEMRKARGEDRP